MPIKLGILYGMLVTILFTPKNTSGSCILTELPKEEGRCVASLQCVEAISFDHTEWPCVRSETKSYDYDYNYGRQHLIHRTVYDDNYFLNIIVQKHVEDEIDIFENFDNLQHVHAFEIDGMILALPEQLHQLTEVTEIKILNGQLSTVNLLNFADLATLTTIRFRNNSISDINTDTAITTPSTSIKTVDISQNSLKAIPKNCFFLFTHMEHLNLSHNGIESFDILTFEGVSQLTTLDVSYNKLYEIGHSFTRFINLRELYLQNNKLPTLLNYNLGSLIKLETLNLSTNAIVKLENNTFKSLTLLKYLDLSENKIEAITKQLLLENEQINSLIISKNHIKTIENLAFEGKNITEFEMQGNDLTGVIEKEVFDGVHVTELNLNNGSVTTLGNETFKSMCNDLRSLNMSFNLINHTSYSAFTCLESLEMLDLSHNQLSELNFDTSSLKNLTLLNLSHNNITNIDKNFVKNFVNLVILDLSHNSITEIALETFVGLDNVNVLTISHNNFVSNLEKKMLDSLYSITSIDLSFTRTTTFQNESFSGLTSVNNINSSHGQLTLVAYNAFLRTGSVEKLDLSHNLLEDFHVNTSSLDQIKELYLSDNEIRHVSDETFTGLTQLKILSLANNNVQQIGMNTFKTTQQLSHLYFSSNTQMKINGNPFDDLPNLYQLNLDNVKSGFTFETANFKVEYLNLHSCGITDINKLFIHKVDLLELNLSANGILKIDRNSFRSMPRLRNLDLSSNKISYIQPGSFFHVDNLKELSLNENNLQMLQYGVFDGIKNLRRLNLSNNALQSFDVKLIRVRAMTLALDNNVISYLNFPLFFEDMIDALSIGGNLIPCKVLAELKSSLVFGFVKTAKLDFHSENVDGITCLSAPKVDGVLPAVNGTGYDMRPVFIQFTNSIEKLRSSIEKVANNTSIEKTNEIKSEITKLGNYLNDLVNISSGTQIKTVDYLNKIENITTAAEIHLSEITDNLTNLTNEAKEIKPNVGIKDNKYENLNVRAEMKIMIKEEIDAIKNELVKSLQNIQKRDPSQQVQFMEKENRDDKVLYFIAAGLGILIMIYVINVAFSYFRNYRTTRSSSIRPIASEMEME